MLKLSWCFFLTFKQFIEVILLIRILKHTPTLLFIYSVAIIFNESGVQQHGSFNHKTLQELLLGKSGKIEQYSETQSSLE